jgi:hypothetical protein
MTLPEPNPRKRLLETTYIGGLPDAVFIALVGVADAAHRLQKTGSIKADVDLHFALKKLRKAIA